MNMINLDFSNCNYISDIHKELKTNLNYRNTMADKALTCQKARVC